MKVAAFLFVANVFVIAVPSGAVAQGYPSRVIRVIVPFGVGGGLDIATRAIGRKLSDLWGQQVVVENRPGAGGVIGTAVVANSVPDGYSLLASSSAFAVSAALYPNLPYDPLKDFSPIVPLGSQPNVLIAAPSSGLKTIGDLIGAAKANPGRFSFGSVGVGSGTHFNGEKFKLAAGIDVVHVPYKGAPEATVDTIAGRITYWFSPVSAALPHIRDGRVVALGVSSARRSSLITDVPTIAEAGLPGFEYTFWYGLWVPARTPAEVAEKLTKDVSRALAALDLREQLNKIGAEPFAMTTAEFARFVRNEINESARIVRAAGIKPE